MPEEPEEEEREEEEQEIFEKQSLLPSEWRTIQGVAYALMALIGLGGVPDDLAQWWTWLRGLLDRGPASYAFILVGFLGLIVLYYPRLWERRKHVVMWFQKQMQYDGGLYMYIEAVKMGLLLMVILTSVLVPFAFIVYLLLSLAEQLTGLPLLE